MFEINPPLLEKLTGKKASKKDERTFTVKGVSIDSRTIAPQELFIALKGENFDGHTYVQKAFHRGAAAAIVSTYADVPPEKQILVRDTQKAFEALAAHKRMQFSGTVIGLTGSAGKTSTRDGIQYILQQFGTTYGTTGNHNNHIGTPLTLCHLPENAKYGVFEMGMSMPGEIRHLTHQVRAHIALITNIYPMHIEFFENLESIAAAKAEIFEGLQPDGIAILNKDAHHADVLLHHAKAQNPKKIITFGQTGDVHYKSITQKDGQTHVVASVLGDNVPFTLSTLGIHRVYNALAILSVVAALGIDPHKAAPFLKDLSPLPGRGKVHHLPLPNGGHFTLIDESYSGQPASTKLALEQLAALTPLKKGRRVAVLGQMAELGSHTKEEHKNLGQSIAALPLDYIVGVGGPMIDALKDCPHPHELRTNKGRLKEDLLAGLLRPDDIVLIKGSRYSSRLFEVVAELLGS